MKLKNILAGAAISAAMTLSAADAPKYIFYYIGDGMGMGPVVAAETYNRTILKNDTPLTMMQMPVVGWCMTYSANALITDSAAAGTALSTGHKTRNNMLGMGPDTTAVQSVAVDLMEKGYGIGIVTSCAPDDATPGAFYAHVPSRKMFYQIGEQMATSGYQFIAGADLRGKAENGQPELTKVFADNNVQIVRGPEGIKEINSDRVLLLNPEGFHDWSISYTIDSVPGALNMPMMAQACINHLERVSPDRFFMMFEGGEIDHALHANDGGAAVKEILNFDQALALAFEFYKAHPDETLIVVTADHDTGGMSMVQTRGAHGGLANVDFQKISKEEFSSYCKGLLKSRNVYTWDDMKDYLSENLGFYSHLKITDAQTEKLKKLFDDTFEKRNTADQETLYANFNAFAVEVYRIFNEATGLAFTTTSHSGNPVPLFAIGVGADNFKGFNNNIDIPTILRKLVK